MSIISKWYFLTIYILSKRVTHYAIGEANNDVCQRSTFGNPMMSIAILDCHTVSKTLSNPSDIALCHAIGQGLSTVHVETHAIGLALYELSAIVLKDPEKFESEVEKRIQYYEERLIYFQNHRDERKRNWAAFLLKDNVENKEKLLHEKRIIDK